MSQLPDAGFRAWLHQTFEFAEGVCTKRDVLYRHHLAMCHAQHHRPLPIISFDQKVLSQFRGVVLCNRAAEGKQKDTPRGCDAPCKVHKRKSSWIFMHMRRRTGAPHESASSTPSANRTPPPRRSPPPRKRRRAEDWGGDKRQAKSARLPTGPQVPREPSSQPDKPSIMPLPSHWLVGAFPDKLVLDPEDPSDGASPVHARSTTERLSREKGDHTGTLEGKRLELLDLFIKCWGNRT